MTKMSGFFLVLFFCLTPWVSGTLHAEDGRNSWTINFTRTAEEKGLDAAVIDALASSHTVLEIMMASSFAGFSDGAVITALSHSGVATSLIIAAAENLGMSKDIVTAALKNANSTTEDELGFSEAQRFNPPNLPSRVAGGNYSYRSVSQATF